MYCTEQPLTSSSGVPCWHSWLLLFCVCPIGRTCYEGRCAGLFLSQALCIHLPPASSSQDLRSRRCQNACERENSNTVLRHSAVSKEEPGKNFPCQPQMGMLSRSLRKQNSNCRSPTHAPAESDLLYSSAIGKVYASCWWECSDSIGGSQSCAKRSLLPNREHLSHSAACWQDTGFSTQGCQ